MASPRLLLFGPPGAGKSALLEAFVQAAPALKAELLDATATVERFQVRPADKGADPLFSDVTVLDGSGKAALEMLNAEEPFAIGPLRKPILAADAVVFVVDVAAPNEQINKEFRQAARWLAHLHAYRGRRTAIADLPVYVVLTKCDLLARKDDTLDSWKKRLGEAIRQYDENFRKFLGAHGDGFGTVQLKVMATSIKHPFLADQPSLPHEPFGVVELFHDCVQSATDFQTRRQTAQSRLQNVVAGLFGLIALLGLTVALLIEFQPQAKGTTLDEKVQSALPKQSAKPAERVAGTVKKLEDREKKLAEIAAHPEFQHLPSATQKEIIHYRDEISQYLQLYEKSQSILKPPHFAKNDGELNDLKKGVREFNLPEAHAKDWEDTTLGRRIKHVRGEYETLETELQREETWIRGQIETNRQLLKSGNRLYGKLLDQEKDAPRQAETWHKQYDAQLNARPATLRDENVPGVARIIYEDLAKFEPVKSAQKEWRTSQDDLTNISALIQKKLRTRF